MENSSQIPLDFNEPDTKGRTTEKRRESIWGALLSRELNTLEHRVASILNTSIDSRNDDSVLVVEYWRRFHQADLHGDAVRLEDYRKLERPDSIVRARRAVQYECGLFEAIPEVKKRRGKLSKEAAEQYQEAPSATRSYTVYVDETGLTQGRISIASIWLLQSDQDPKLTGALRDWRTRTGFNATLHFADMSRNQLTTYLEAFDCMLDAVPLVSLRALSVPASGAGHTDQVISELLYHMLIRGISHEHESGRAPLPRILSLFKDRSRTGKDGYDALQLGKIQLRLKEAGKTLFNDQLFLGMFDAIDDGESAALQFTDLFAGSVNRYMATNGELNGNHKDDFAKHVLGRLTLNTTEFHSSMPIGDHAIHEWLGVPPKAIGG